MNPTAPPPHSPHSAPTLALVPHSGSSIPSFARSLVAPPRRATPFSQPTVADLFAAAHRLEDCVHTLTVNQRNMALQLGTLHTSFAELQQHTSNLEQRLVRQREMQDELDSNTYSAHTRVAELQSMLRNQSSALEALQQHSAGQHSNMEQRIARLRTAQDELDSTAHNAHERISSPATEHRIGWLARHAQPGNHRHSTTQAPHWPCTAGYGHTHFGGLARPAWGLLLCLSPFLYMTGPHARLAPQAAASASPSCLWTAASPGHAPPALQLSAEAQASCSLLLTSIVSRRFCISRAAVPGPQLCPASASHLHCLSSARSKLGTHQTGTACPACCDPLGHPPCQTLAGTALSCPSRRRTDCP